MKNKKNDSSESKVNIFTQKVSQKEASYSIENSQLQKIIDSTSRKTTEECNKIRDEFKTYAETDKASLITVFGIFASIISFLTIEFQFLKTCYDLKSIVGFSLILFVLLLGFNTGLDYLIKSRLEKNIAKPNLIYLLVIATLFASGICFIFTGNEEKGRENKIYQKFSDEFEKRHDKLTKELTDLAEKINTQNAILISLPGQNLAVKHPSPYSPTYPTE